MEERLIMKILPFKENPVFPFLLIDDFYNEKEEKLIWQELDFYTIDKFISNKDDKTLLRAVDEKTGKSKNSSYRIYLDQVYQANSRHVSNILTLYKKIISEEIKEVYKGITPAWKLLDWSDRDLSQISYYDEGDRYDSHADVYGCSVMIWFYREPKRFKGGDFYFDDPNTKVVCKHNRLLMFPSYYMHSVTPVTMEKEYREKGFGRYALTHFYFNSHGIR